MNQSKLPTSLQTLRTQRGWSQEELAQASGVSARTVQRLEAGALPSLETSRAIAAAFDLEPSDIFESKQDPQPHRGFAQTGARWGIRGALLGYACAFVAVGYTFLTGGSSGFEAGVTLGILGMITGLICVGINRLSHRPVETSEAPLRT